LAREIKKPLVVHVRDAHDDCYRILSEEKLTRGAIHCFTGNKNDAKRYLDLGFIISVSGIVTYAKTESLQEAVAFTPADRLMVETDSPYLSPVPYRGKKNEPARVAEVARAVARIKGMDDEAFGLLAARTASELFGFRLFAV
jgi:TatD DNase family protein